MKPVDVPGLIERLKADEVLAGFADELAGSIPDGFEIVVRFGPYSLSIELWDDSQEIPIDSGPVDSEERAGEAVAQMLERSLEIVRERDLEENDDAGDGDG